MKKILLVVLGLLLMFGTLANATVTDVIQYPTEYFVDVDANKYDSPYYRWYGEDWGWTHNAIGGSITSATLNISAFDVDYSDGERDAIYAYDDSTKTFLGYLAGGSDIWSYTTFALGASFYNDIASGLMVWMEIDTTHAGWAVTLAKSALSIDGGTLPNPNPNPVPEPATLLLFGVGLVGVGIARRLRRQA